MWLKAKIFATRDDEQIEITQNDVVTHEETPGTVVALDVKWSFEGNISCHLDNKKKPLSRGFFWSVRIELIGLRKPTFYRILKMLVALADILAAY